MSSFYSQSHLSAFSRVSCVKIIPNVSSQKRNEGKEGLGSESAFHTCGTEIKDEGFLFLVKQPSKEIKKGGKDGSGKFEKARKFAHMKSISKFEIAVHLFCAQLHDAVSVGLRLFSTLIIVQFHLYSKM